MQTVQMTFSVFFEMPYWVGVLECQSDRKLKVCKIVFGPEPKDYEVYEFLLKNWAKLKFSPSIQAERIQYQKINPKRLQRQIARSLRQKTIGTKAQEAIRAQQEENKLQKRKKRKENKDAYKEKQFALKQTKKKEKHKGH